MEGSVATGLIGISRALGSGWQIRLNQPPPAAAPTEPENLPQPPANEDVGVVETSRSTDPGSIDLAASLNEPVSNSPSAEFIAAGPVDRILRNQMIQQYESPMESPAAGPPPQNVVLESRVLLRKVTELNAP